MVPLGKAGVFTKHKQVIISALCPTGIGVAGVNVVLVFIGELLLSDNWSYCVVCSDRMCSKGSQQKKYSSQCRVGLCAMPCNKRYHTLKNYKLEIDRCIIFPTFKLFSIIGYQFCNI